MLTKKRNVTVVTKRDDVVLDPPTDCSSRACRARLGNVYYLNSQRRPLCVSCAMSGGPESRVKKYVKPQGASTYRKVEG